MTETVEHDLIPPAKLPVTLTTANLSCGGSFVPVHSPHQTLPYVELVVHLPLLQLALLALLGVFLFFFAESRESPLIFGFLCPSFLSLLLSFVLNVSFTKVKNQLASILCLPWQEVLSLPGPVADDPPVNVDVDQLWRHGVLHNTRLISKEFVIVNNIYN